MQIQPRAGVIACVDNIGKARSTGTELSCSALLGNGFSVRLIGAHFISRSSTDFTSATEGFIPSATVWRKRQKRDRGGASPIGRRQGGLGRRPFVQLFLPVCLTQKPDNFHAAGFLPDAGIHDWLRAADRSAVTEGELDRQESHG